MFKPTHEQHKAIEAYVQGTLSPLIGKVLTKQLGMAAVFLRDELTGPTLGGGKLDPVHPNYRPDLRYVLETLQMVLPVLKNDGLRGQVEASINGMGYILRRTEDAAKAGVPAASHFVYGVAVRAADGREYIVNPDDPAAKGGTAVYTLERAAGVNAPDGAQR